jgi:predicted enzyme related to lactoylglutathione lyase
MAKITGIGGFFFRAEDPAALADWYRQHFEIDRVPEDYDTAPWQQEAGPTVFAPFEKDTDYFGNPSKSWMLNLRVRNLDEIVNGLRAQGIPVTVDETKYPNGRFARLKDPEGNPIQLWEPLNV